MRKECLRFTQAVYGGAIVLEHYTCVINCNIVRLEVDGISDEIAQRHTKVHEREMHENESCPISQSLEKHVTCYDQYSPTYRE
ncbi:MAG: hypothetical protein MJE68_10140 [Proteobacteria bacterium]|nr:hypothetical protein [Pseudomonadota bacterium]